MGSPATHSGRSCRAAGVSVARQLARAAERGQASAVAAGWASRQDCRPEPQIRAQATAPPLPALEGAGLRGQMAKFKQGLLVEALRQTDGHRKAAAEALGMPLSSFFRWQKEAGLPGWQPNDPPPG
jgi:DNA-binding NtrC family response regulator